MAAVQRLMAALITALLLLPACGKNAVLHGDAESGNDTVEIEDPSTPDESGDTLVDPDGRDGDGDDLEVIIIDTIDEEDGPFVCETDRYLPADNIFEPGWWGPQFVFEIPTGYAWVSSLPDLSLWRLVTAPSTFDAIDISVILDGLPATTLDGGTVPAVDVNAVYSADSGLAFLMLGYPLGGSSLDTYGALYGLDGHARVPPTVLSASAGHDIDRLVATDGGGFAYLFCAYSAETFCYTCEVGGIDEIGNVTGPFDVQFSFGSGNAFWNRDEFVVIAYEGCGYEGSLLWRSVALDGSVTREAELGYYGADLEVHPSQVGVGDSDVGICIQHFPGRWGNPHALSFMRTDRSGNLLNEPVRIYELSGIATDLSISFEKYRGYAMILGELTSEDVARVVFIRLDFEGTIRQETILDELNTVTEMSADPLFWEEDHFVAGWGAPYKMGSLVCR